MTPVTTSDEPRAKQIAAAVREERTGYIYSRLEELAKRPKPLRVRGKERACIIMARASTISSGKYWTG